MDDRDRVVESIKYSDRDKFEESTNGVDRK
jgi:hypothetical protein